MFYPTRFSARNDTSARICMTKGCSLDSNQETHAYFAPEKGEPGDGNRRVKKKERRNSIIGFWGNPSPCDDNSYITSHCFEERYVSLKVFWELFPLGFCHPVGCIIRSSVAGWQCGRAAVWLSQDAGAADPRDRGCCHRR